MNEKLHPVSRLQSEMLPDGLRDRHLAFARDGGFHDVSITSCGMHEPIEGSLAPLQRGGYSARDDNIFFVDASSHRTLSVSCATRPSRPVPPAPAPRRDDRA